MEQFTIATSSYDVISPAAAGGKSKLVLGLIIGSVVILVVLAIVLGVYYGTAGSKRPAYDPNFQNKIRPAGQPEEVEIVLGGGKLPVVSPQGYERTYPRQLTAAEQAAISIGSVDGLGRIPGPRTGSGTAVGKAPPPSGASTGSSSMAVPVLTIGQLEQLVTNGMPFTVILFSKTCPACTRLVNSVTEWSADGSLSGAKVALLETSEWGKATSPVVKAALSTKAVPFSVNFKDGASGSNQLGAMPKDAFLKFIAQQ